MGHVDKCSKNYSIANSPYEGALTQNPNTPFHSCESRASCPVRDSSNVVQIIPITSSIQIKEPSDRENESQIILEEHSLLKRKRALHDNGSERHAKRIPLKEPGHQLLIPRGSWWTKDSSKERSPIISDEGESLPYFIVATQLVSS